MHPMVSTPYPDASVPQKDSYPSYFKVTPPVSTSSSADEDDLNYTDNVDGIEDNEDGEPDFEPQVSGTKHLRSPSPNTLPSKQPKQATSRPKISDFATDVQAVTCSTPPSGFGACNCILSTPFPSLQGEAVVIFALTIAFIRTYHPWTLRLTRCSWDGRTHSPVMNQVCYENVFGRGDKNSHSPTGTAKTTMFLCDAAVE
ncbi:hypothetical protein ONZ45_g16146 [Pleurotus djamor]|nr:hypothetical protein ONZ45_g16146 [Pleurotus djamor]